MKIKTIGVVTYWQGNSNYGMLLQCWALQRYLIKSGFDPFVIRYDPKGSLIRRLIKDIIFLFRRVTNSHIRREYREYQLLSAYNNQKDQLRGFSDFRQSNIIMSNLCYEHLWQLKRNPPIADCYIAGSDQIWSGHLKARDTWGYFLNFGHTQVLRVAYAPSFGKTRISKDYKKLLKKALSKFDYISCREYAGVRFCKDLGYPAVKVEDPTLLLSKLDYDSICADIPYDNHIFIYTVNIKQPQDIYWDTVKEYFDCKNVIATTASGNTMGGEIFGDEVEYMYATIGEWLSLIKKSSFIITSSFHAVVFSIIFNKKFGFVPIKGAHESSNNRITDLLQSVGLNELVVNNKSDYHRILNLNIDWKLVNENKEKLLESSKQFLLNALK